METPTGETSHGRSIKKTSVFDYFKAELTRNYALELEEERYAARREKVYTFMNIPKELERLMAYGFFHCADAFLFIFTFLPLRCLLCSVRYVSIVTKRFFKNFVNIFRRNNVRVATPATLRGAERCDLLKLMIFLICSWGFSRIDTSILYHVVKSQSVIKLYIFFNMLEVGDRLLNSFVQDTLDALFLTATEKSSSFWDSGRKSQMSVSAHLLLTIFTVFLHAFLLLMQGTCISVAINARNHVLLTVMMSNNFVELKGSVFKKFDKINLFQVSCSDIRERFHLCVLLLVVFIQTMREYSWEEFRFWTLLPVCLGVICAEIGVDWVKHAFITRFNEISSDVYKEYTLSLAYDLAQTKQKKTLSDHCDMTGRRLGFVPLPLAVVLTRVIKPSLKGPLFFTISLSILGFIALFTVRLLSSIVLLGKACELIDHHDTMKSKAPTRAGTPLVGMKAEIGSNLKNVKTQQTFKLVPQEKNIKQESSLIKQYGDNEDALKLQELEMVSKKLMQHNSNFVKPWKPYNRRKKYQSMNRSISASHSPPRSQLRQSNSLKETPVPDLPPIDSNPLLMANSTVSILSLPLNEEVFKTEESEKENVKLPSPSISPVPGHARKLSLGSRLDNEFSASADNASVNEIKQEIKTHIEDEVEKELEDIDLDTTLVDQTENTKEFADPSLSPSGEENEGPKRRKKKGLGLFVLMSK